MNKRINKFVTISSDGTVTYEKFRWFAEWVAYCETLHDDMEQLAFHESIAKYGLKGEEPTEIAGAALEYFNQKIRPELDRQHERMRKGRDI